ncbi:MAG: glycosyltransferase family 39 protein [Armatimonadota bacterium]
MISIISPQAPVLLSDAPLLALLLNALVAYYRPATSPDSDRYQRIAINLADGNGYSASEAAPYQPDLLRVPLYPKFIATVIRLAGPNWTAVRLVQALLMSFLVPLGWLIAARCFDRTTALVTAFAVACYPTYWLYAGQLLSDGVAAVVTAVAAVALIRSLRDKGLIWSLLAGLAGGLMCLIKPVMLLFPAVALIAYVVGADTTPRLAVRRWAVYVLTFALTVMPWTIRNYAVSGKLIPMTAGKGIVLYQIARLSETGFTIPQYHQQIETADPRLLVARAAPDPAVTLQLDRDLTRDGMAIIHRHPWRYLCTIACNPLLVWVNRWTFVNGVMVQSRTLLLLSLMYLVTGVLGIMLQRQQWRRAIVPLTFIVYISLVHAPLWTEPRQSIPARLFLLMFVAYAVARGLARARPGIYEEADG